MWCLTFNGAGLHAIVCSKERCKWVPCRIPPVFKSAEVVSHFSSPEYNLLAERKPKQAASKTQYGKIIEGKIRTNVHCTHANYRTAAKEGPTFFSTPWEFYN